MFGILRRLLAGIWGILTLPIDLVGRSVEALGRAVEPVADRVARAAGRVGRSVAEAVPYVGAGVTDVLRAPFEAFRPVTVQQVAPEERGSGWEPAVADSTWGVYAFMWACSVAKGQAPTPLDAVPAGVRAWLQTLSPAEVVALTRVMPDAIERHVSGQPNTGIRGIRPFMTASRAEAVERAKQRIHRLTLEKAPRPEPEAEDYAPRMI